MPQGSHGCFRMSGCVRAALGYNLIRQCETCVDSKTRAIAIKLATGNKLQRQTSVERTESTVKYRVEREGEREQDDIREREREREDCSFKIKYQLRVGL